MPKYPTRAKGTSRFYDAEDTPRPLNRNAKPKSAKLRASIKPGTVLILLAGRFRAKRVVFLKQLESGLLLVTGPYKVNGVPLRRVNQAYVIATSKTFDVSGVNVSKVNDKFFARTETEAATGEDAFIAAEAAKKVELPVERKNAQKAVDAALLSKLGKVDKAYLNAKFSLKKNDRPHAMTF